jgi:serine-type D-Ala-D-Ala carboxypeptidase (penicillin-binding protein 5/6)
MRWFGGRGITLLFLFFTFQGLAQAALPLPLPKLPSPSSFQSAILVEAETGRVLFATEPHKRWYTASLTKMMVGLLALEEVEQGQLALNTSITISPRASRVGERRINLRAKEKFTLAELLQATLVTSANDAAVAVAEGIKGSVEACLQAMNKRAQELGMTETVYWTVNGLPSPKQGSNDFSSAADVAILARELLKYPQVLAWTSQKRVLLRHGRLRLPNTNRLVGELPGVDGFKTGFHNRAGFNLAVTAQRENLRLVAIIMGGKSSQTRFDIGKILLEWGFSHFARIDMVNKGEPFRVEVVVEGGSIPALQPVAAADASFLVRKGEVKDLQVGFQFPPVISAPISYRQIIGEVIVQDGGRVLAIIPALSPYDVPRAHKASSRKDL